MRYLLVGILGSLFFSMAAPASAPAASYPELQVAQAADASYNWAGYVAEGEKYSGVSGSWIVPNVSPGKSLAADAAWVGIGGTDSDDLIQAGTQAVVDPSGDVVYQAWVETMPEPSEPLPIDIAPGDHVAVSLTEVSPNVWKLDFKNITTNDEYQARVAYVSSRSSAEWVEEMPSALRGGFIPLDSFGAIRFTAASALVGGEQKDLAALDAEPLNMVNRRGEELAAISVVGPDGGFNVTRTDAAPQVSARRRFAPRAFLPLLPASGIPHERHP